MASVDMVAIRKEFGSSVALEEFSVSIKSGELICLLGPSGCGKTTALRILAGFERADSGRVLIEGRDVAGEPPERRRFGMVFQDYSLFPNMTARQNIEFGLKVQKKGPVERREVVDRMIDVTHLGEHAEKFPHQMSGGQRQRVALARAIATAPRVLLLDEPLSALDAQVRETLRDEIRRLQLEFGVTTVFVTHDQHEALAIADRVGVMSQGRLEQIAAPRELYERPVNAFVAGFIGTVNRIPAKAGAGGRWQVLNRNVEGSESGSPGVEGVVAVRPEHIALDHGTLAHWRIEATSFLGPVTRLVVSGTNPVQLIVDLPSTDAADFSVGNLVDVRLRDDVGHVTVITAEAVPCEVTL
jgi:putative spermidine/putrescine transport system ATP-binding protein